MDRKIISALIIFFSLISCKSQQIQPKIKPTTYKQQDITTDRENSKKYALCSCLAINGYKYEDASKKDNSAYVYISKGLKHPEFYSSLYNFTEQHLKKTAYNSFQGSKTTLKMAECIDFYTSKSLEDYIISIENSDFND